MQRKWFLSQKEKRAQVPVDSKVNFDYALIPEIICPTLVRVGPTGDGGKWVCNPWLFSRPCVVFSLGVGGNSGFEEELGRMLLNLCTTYSFDPDKNYEKLFNNIPSGRFLPWRISGETKRQENVLSIRDAMLELNVQEMEVLEMDIEGSEYEAIPSVFAAFKGRDPPFCQLLLEVHDTKGLAIWRDLLGLISANGFLVFFKEANMFCPGCATEYAFVHQSCLKRLGLASQPFHRNFPNPQPFLQASQG